MTRRTLIRPQAADELREARRWYEAQRRGLGQEFVAEFQRVLQTAVEAPERAPVVEGDLRRALLRRFPYGLFYRVQARDLVVIAVFHLRRDPAALG